MVAFRIRRKKKRGGGVIFLSSLNNSSDYFFYLLFLGFFFFFPLPLSSELFAGDFEDRFNYRKYYFTKRMRKDQKGKRVKRSMNEGFWKNTIKDKVIKDANNKEVGYYKTFKFFEGKDKKVKKSTNWIMHEFRDLQTDSAMDDESTSTNFSKVRNHPSLQCLFVFLFFAILLYNYIFFFVFLCKLRTFR